jgi:hypothetical protein
MEVMTRMQAFYQCIEGDARISATHISIYMGLLYAWSGDSQEPLQLTRVKIMRLAKISARQTFNKCMHELNTYGYIRYIPSTGPFQPSLIYLQKI